jgi:integrase
MAYTFTRTGELRAAEWKESISTGAVWRIPAERMKMGEEHIVPLSRQALAVLAELKLLTGTSRLLFPNERRPQKPMSENTVLYALYRMGYHSRATGQASVLRSTMLTELGFDPERDWCQLAHRERNKVRAAYTAPSTSPSRDMMQAWAITWTSSPIKGVSPLSTGPPPRASDH